MRLSEFRLPFAGVLFLAASSLMFVFATNGASESPGTVERPATVAATSVAVVRRGEDDRRAVLPAAKHTVAVVRRRENDRRAVTSASKGHAAARNVAARAVPSRGSSRRHAPSRSQPRAAASVAKVNVPRIIATAAPKRAALHGPAVAWQPFSIVRFVGSKKVIARGDSVTLCAKAVGAAHLRIVPLGPVDPGRRTCRVVRPRHSTTYTLLAEAPGGAEVTQNVTVAVRRRTPSRRAPRPRNLDLGP